MVLRKDVGRFQTRTSFLFHLTVTDCLPEALRITVSNGLTIALPVTVTGMRVELGMTVTGTHNVVDVTILNAPPTQMIR